MVSFVLEGRASDVAELRFSSVFAEDRTFLLHRPPSFVIILYAGLYSRDLMYDSSSVSL